MNRVSLINKIISETNGKSYLEIGCYRGKTFYKIKAPRKIGVDPNFHREFYVQWFKTLIKIPLNLGNIKYYRQTSDEFFTKRKPELKKYGNIAVIFIDGLHTFRASLKDLVNALKYIDENGVIILHDCYPPNAAAATPSEQFPTPEEARNIKGWTGAWCGDVWKTMAYVKKEFSKELDCWVLNADNGLGVVIPKPKTDYRNLQIVESNIKAIDKLEYHSLVPMAKEWINLVEEMDFHKIVKAITKQEL